MAEINSIRRRWIVVYSTGWCSQSRRTKALLKSHRLPFEDNDIDRDPAAARQVEEWNEGYRSVPTLDIRLILVRPSIADLERILLAPGVRVSDLTIYTDDQSPLLPRISSWLADYSFDYVKVDIEKDDEAAHQVRAWNDGTLAVPVLDMRLLVTEPTDEELERILGINNL